MTSDNPTYVELERDRDRWKAGNEGLVSANRVLIRQLEIDREELVRLRSEVERLKVTLREAIADLDGHECKNIAGFEAVLGDNRE